MQTGRSFFSSLKEYLPDIGFLNVPCLLFVAAGILSVIFSQIPLRSLSNLFFEFLQNILFMCFFVETFQNRRQIVTIIKIFFASMTLVGINGLWQFYTGEGFILKRSLVQEVRIMSTLKHPNDLGAYLMLMLGLSFGVFNFYLGEMRSSKKWTALLFCLITILLVCVGWTYSRGAWAALIIMVVVLIGLLHNKRSLIYILLIGCFLGIFMPQMHKYRNVSFMTDRYRQLQNEIKLASVSVDRKEIKKEERGSSGEPINLWREVKKDEHFSASGRFGFWREAWQVIKTYPVFGMGLNTYTEMTERKFPHNSFLRMTAEIGFVGFLTYAWMMLVFLGNFLACYSRISDRYLRSVSIGLMSGFMGFLAHSFVDTHFYSIQLATLMWVSMGMIMAIMRVAEMK